MTQQGTSAGEGVSMELESGKAGLDGAGSSELPSTGAASDGNQVLNSRAGQANDAQRQTEDHSSELATHRGVDGQPAHHEAEGHQQLAMSPDIAADGDAAADAPSPASSSEDAPGSDYDETEQRDLLMDATTPDEAEVHGPTVEPLAEQDTADRPQANEGEQAEVERQDGGEAESKEDSESPSEQHQPAEAAATMEESEPVPAQSANAQSINGGLTLMADTVLGEIGHVVAETTGDAQVEDEAGPTAIQEPTSVQLVAESITAVSEQPRSPAYTTRPAEDPATTSSKRLKLDDSISTPEPPAPPVNESTVAAPAPKKKQPARKSAKPPAKPKAPPKPKKEPKAKGKKPAAQVAPTDEGIETEVVLDPSLVADPNTAATKSSTRTFILDQVEPPTDQEPEVKAKKTRKTPTRSRKQPAETAAATTDDQAQTVQPVEAPNASSAPIESFLMRATAEREALGSAAVAPEPEVKPKGKGKQKAPSKAKGKAEAMPADPFEASSGVPVSLAPITLPPLKKPTPKRTATKKGKGPVAKLRPAQADGAVSELELEPVQQLPSIASFHPRPGRSQEDEDIGGNAACGAVQHPGHGTHASYRATEDQQQQAPPALPTLNSDYTSSNIFASMQPPQYPAQAYWPTRAETMQHQNRALSTLTNAAASMLESETHWSSEASSANMPGSTSSATYEGTHEATSPTTVGNAAGSVAGDDVSEVDAAISPAEAFYKWELDPRIHPTGWRLPHFDVIDPDLLKTSMRDSTVWNSTVWTFWDCYLPLGCRDQDMVLLSNDNIAFPCAAWNPCLFSTMLNRVIKNPNRVVAQILERGFEENRKKLGYKPLPCIWIDENWHATNLLLSFLHPIPTMFLPDRATCRLVMDLGLRYGVERAVAAATSRTHQIDEEDKRAANDKGKGRAREDEIAADLAQRAA